MDETKGPIVIAGSVNIDISLAVSRLPGPGETLLADAISVSGGGKSGNQAVACGRLGGDIALVARVGDDDYGRLLMANMAEAGVNTDYLTVDPVAPTGQAYIGVAASGENNIIVVQGANGQLLPETVKAALPLIQGASYVSTQLEIPLTTVHALAELCAAHKVQFVLNPSPVAALPDELLSSVSILVLNEHELAVLAGPGDEAAQLARLLGRGVGQVVLTKGGDGVVLADKNRTAHYDAFKVDVVDTTGAGDTFTGALLVALSENRDMAEAIAFAQRAAAIQVTRRGAQDAVPWRAEVDSVTWPVNEQR